MPYWTVEDHIRLDKKNQIGQGLFSKVFKVSETEVIILTNDNAKECMGAFCQGEKHIPKMERLSDIGEYQAYKMPLYQKLMKKHSRAWEDYKAVEKTLKYLSLRKYDCFPTCINAIEKSEDLSEDLKESLKTLIDMMANYTDDIFLDLCKRNVMVDNKGNLILTDIVGSSQELSKAWARKFQKRKKKEYSRFF